MTKTELDDFKIGRGIPNCVIEACPLCDDSPQLLHQIILNGIKPPHHKLVLSYMPSRIKGNIFFVNGCMKQIIHTINCLINAHTDHSSDVVQPQTPAAVQPQVDVGPQPLTFSKDMSNEQLALWLSNHPNLTGTDYQEDITKLKSK